jgi:hypothetical protein
MNSKDIGGTNDALRRVRDFAERVASHDSASPFEEKLVPRKSSQGRPGKRPMQFLTARQTLGVFLSFFVPPI